jgi:hypothetical protein
MGADAGLQTKKENRQNNTKKQRKNEETSKQLRALQRIMESGSPPPPAFQPLKRDRDVDDGEDDAPAAPDDKKRTRVT